MYGVNLTKLKWNWQGLTHDISGSDPLIPICKIAVATTAAAVSDDIFLWMAMAWYKSYYLHCLLQIYIYIQWEKNKTNWFYTSILTASEDFNMHVVKYLEKQWKCLWKHSCLCFLLFFLHVPTYRRFDIVFHIYQFIYIYIY